MSPTYTDPLYVLFAAAGKHAMDDSMRVRRSIAQQEDRWRKEHARAFAERLRLAAWDHLHAAREAKRRAAA